MVFFDTSILVSAFIEMTEGPSPAQAALDAISRQRVRRRLTAWHCVLEFYSVPARLPGNLRIEPKVAGQLVREEILDRFGIRDVPAGTLHASFQPGRCARVRNGSASGAFVARMFSASHSIFFPTR